MVEIGVDIFSETSIHFGMAGNFKVLIPQFQFPYYGKLESFRYHVGGYGPFEAQIWRPLNTMGEGTTVKYKLVHSFYIRQTHHKMIDVSTVEFNISTINNIENIMCLQNSANVQRLNWNKVVLL